MLVSREAPAVQARTTASEQQHSIAVLAAVTPTWCRAMALGPASRLAKGSTNSASGSRDSMARAAAQRTERECKGGWLSVWQEREGRHVAAVFGCVPVECCLLRTCYQPRAERHDTIQAIKLPPRRPPAPSAPQQLRSGGHNAASGHHPGYCCHCQ